ncbi:MAG TPA: hypothetical protein VF661_04845 [Actinomycetales bacterium]|jgi:hypothetical protein
MRTTTTLGAFALGLTVVFAAAVGVGDALGPVGTASAATSTPAGAHGGEAGDHADAGSGHADEPDGHAQAPAPQPEGLSASADGYTLRLHTPSLPQAASSELALTILGPDGEPVTAFTPTHDEELHLVVVRRDGTGFRHVHPERDAAGRWTVPITLPDAGSYKVFADTAPQGRDEALTLAADLQVAGDYRPVPIPAPSPTATVDGYTVRLTGDLVAGRTSPLSLSVSRDGRPVTDLQPYLAAYGHLVSLREGDLAYLHTHPEGAPDDGRTPAGPDVSFGVDVPTEGTYLLYLDFKHDGVVRTAAFVATARSAS